jgi:hypothetical protein
MPFQLHSVNLFSVPRVHSHFILFLDFFFVSFSFKGDEVIEWNGRSLQGKSSQEVCDVIEESRHESQIELIVSRPLSVNRKAAQASWRQSHSPIRAQTRQYLHKGSHQLDYDIFLSLLWFRLLFRLSFLIAKHFFR